MSCRLLAGSVQGKMRPKDPPTLTPAVEAHRLECVRTLHAHYEARIEMPRVKSKSVIGQCPIGGPCVHSIISSHRKHSHGETRAHGSRVQRVRATYLAPPYVTATSRPSQRPSPVQSDRAAVVQEVARVVAVLHLQRPSARHMRKVEMQT